MDNNILELFAGQNNLTWQVILMNILFSTFLGIIIYLSYYLTHRGTIYSKKFNVSLVILTVLTGTVMTVIGNNLALSLGMVGALSIVRFRTAIKDARDTMYIFWAIIVGICCGVSDFLVSSIGSAVVFLVLFIFHSIKNDKRMLLIIRGKRELQEQIQAAVFNIFERKAVLRVRNTTHERVEMIYEISSELLQHAERGKHSICDEIYELGEIEYVNVVMQNDEISG
jgi:heme exporter protein D